MARPEFTDLPAKGSATTAQTGAAPSRTVDRFRDKAVAFDFTTNTFVGSVQLEGTMNGSTWFPIGAVVNADKAVVQVPYTVLKLRTNITVATSGGVPVVTCGGLDFRAL